LAEYQYREKQSSYLRNKKIIDSYTLNSGFGLCVCEDSQSFKRRWCATSAEKVERRSCSKI